jgi:hypothetical protein
LINHKEGHMETIPKNEEQPTTPPTELLKLLATE